MTHKEQIDLYLSGSADRNSKVQIENALLEDTVLLEQFISASEQAVYEAPLSLAGSVMGAITRQNEPHTTISIPILSKNLCAAVCFSSAAAIMIFTVFGFDRHLSDFISNYSIKLNELLIAIKIF